MPPKRKRSATTSSQTAPAVDIVQPSSRDASEEDIEDPILKEVSQLKQKQSEASGPMPKRSRSSNDGEADSIVDGPKTRSRRGTANSQKAKDEKAKAEDRAEHGEGGERGTMRMTPPPKAGLVDPVGYKTNPPPEGRQIRVYADGVFDLFHLGHMRQLQQCKTAFPDVYLLVGVTGDKETHRRKGLTVLSAKERAESVRHCKWVDEVIEDCPWIITDAPEFLEKHKIDYVAHDDIPYGADEGDDIYAPIKEKGMFLVTQRTEGVSTTGIISKIVRDYDKYITRQLKRGTSRQELNVSWLKKNELDIKRTMGELRENIKNNWSAAGQEIGRELRQFWQPSRPASPARIPAEFISNGDHAHTSPKGPVAHLARLEVPPRVGTPTGASSDFAAGYSLGLIGGVRSWMARSRRNLNESRPESPNGDSDPDSMGERSPRSPDGTEPVRGRQGRNEQELVNAQMRGEMDLRP